jgi:hypothetical protein
VTQAAPKSITKDLIEEIVRLQRIEKVDEVTLRRVKKDADKLEKVDRTTHFMLMGMIASLERDGEAVRRNFRAALALDHNVVLVNNYLISLVAMYDFEHAVEIANSYEGKFRDDITFQKAIANILIECAAMESASRWTRAWCESSTENPLSADPLERIGLRAYWGALSYETSLMASTLRPFYDWGSRSGMPETELVRAAQEYRKWHATQGNMRPRVAWHGTFFIHDECPTLIYETMIKDIAAGRAFELERDAMEHLVELEMPAVKEGWFAIGVGKEPAE